MFLCRSPYVMTFWWHVRILYRHLVLTRVNFMIEMCTPTEFVDAPVLARVYFMLEARAPAEVFAAS